MYDYDAFGGEKEPIDTDPNPFRYCGEYFDRETGTVYLRNRIYNPTIGRFTSEDPVKSLSTKLPNEQSIIDPLSLNLYTYCYNDPISYVDPLGTWIEAPGSNYDAARIRDYLQELTYDTVSLDGKRIVINEVDNPDSIKALGTELLRGLNVSGYKTEVFLGGSYSHKKISEDTSRIIITGSNPELLLANPLTSIDKGGENTPVHIALAHELIHAYRSKMGDSDSFGQQSHLYFVERPRNEWKPGQFPIELRREVIRAEEYQTTFGPYRINENAIRTEQETPLPLRGAYKG